MYHKRRGGVCEGFDSIRYVHTTVSADQQLSNNKVCVGGVVAGGGIMVKKLCWSFIVGLLHSDQALYPEVKNIDLRLDNT
jgi:hypothetical protein